MIEGGRRGGSAPPPPVGERAPDTLRPATLVATAPAGQAARPPAPAEARPLSSRPLPSRPPWDFAYLPLATAAVADEAAPLDAVIAARSPVAPSRVADALRAAAPGAEVDLVLERAPLFWLRARAPQPARRADVEAALRAAGLAVRYVASSRSPSAEAAPRIELPAGASARPDAWRPRRASRGLDPETPGRWFLRAAEGGIAVDRRRSGGGAGTRLAVIDDDAASIEQLDLDREVLVLLDRPPRSHSHGALMVAWAVGGQRPGVFRGVAPDASPRLYLVPKPGACLLALPLAIVRAVSDGADVIVCATYLEGSTSPMLDDALELAWRAGRGGRGTPVVLPTGREASSPEGSLHASFSLGFGEPASDPRVFCVGPSGRGDGWFLWRDRKGRSRPFANRGPSVRWLAPGDDMAYPFRPGGGMGPVSERLFHAESSGASAVAAGVLLLVLAKNPGLRVQELDLLVTLTVDPIAPAAPAAGAPYADPWDLLPAAADRDGHNAKHGYGRMNAGRACLAAGDPVALSLVLMGHDGAARAWHDARRVDPLARGLYSRRLGRWAVRALLADASLSQAARAIVRHARLLAGKDARRRAHGPGAAARQVALLLRELASSRSAPRPPPRVRSELDALRDAAERATAAAERLDAIFAALAARLFGPTAEAPSPPSRPAP